MQIVNVKDVAKGTELVYCGRSRGWWGMPSLMGNPFSHHAISQARHIGESREEVILAYKHYLWATMQGKAKCTVVLKGQKVEIDVLLTKSIVEEFFASLTDESILACHCKPQACHCDVIAAAYMWWKSQNNRP